MTPSDIPSVHRLLMARFKVTPSPIIELIAAQTNDPFKVLIGTILSARTKDACTAAACRRLLPHITVPEDLERIPLDELASLIYPVGFYRAKAQHLHDLPRALEERFGGVLPQTVEELCELPGVGRKTANLVVAVGFDKPAVCVDVHVHRISNRLGLVSTKTPYDTEMALRATMPKRYWKTWNSIIVSFGQTLCSPRNPRCADCPVRQYCDFGATRQA